MFKWRNVLGTTKLGEEAKKQTDQNDKLKRLNFFFFV